MGEREWRSLLQLHGFGKNAQLSPDDEIFAGDIHPAITYPFAV